MRFTDIFIRRPVLATVVSLLILVLGLRAMSSLQVLQYPKTENAVVTITTIYYGADPNIVAGFVTTPLEGAIAQANGIDYMSSTSQSGVSTIIVYLRLNYDPDKALTEINTKISSVLNQLPTGTQQPTLTVKVGQTIDAMYIGFNSTVLGANQITDYLIRVVQPKLQAVPGVQTAELLGGKYFALRAWLDPQKLASQGLTAADVSQALVANNYISGVGTTKGQMVQVNLSASTDLHTLDSFRNLVLKQSGPAIVRLKDVAKVTLGDDDYESAVGFDGQNAVYIGIQVAPGANLLDVIKGVRTAFPGIQAELPQGLNGTIVYDSTDFVSSSISEVIRSLVEAVLIVTVVVFVFLGSPRSVLIPVIAIPLSLIGTFTMMLMFGFSINLLTLLALVLAIGLVVDDAIIVVENVNRHLEDGMRPIPAAIQAAHELGGPIIAMTVVLIAVYVPIGFQGGLTGALFTEFAFTLVGAVTVSAVIALTLSPMLGSRLLRAHVPGARDWESRTVAFIDRGFGVLHRGYQRWLAGSLNYLPVTATFALIILGSIYFFYTDSKSELAPDEDQGVILAFATSAPNATLEQRLLYDRQVYQDFAGYPETAHVFQLDVPGQNFSGMVLKPWDARTRTSMVLQPLVQQQLAGIAGQQVVSFPPSPLPGGVGCRCSSSSAPPNLRATERCDPELPSAGVGQRTVYLPQYRPAHRQSPGDDRDRPQQGGADGPENERRRRRDGFDAGRWLRQLFRPRWAVLQGHSAGAAALPAQPVADPELLCPHRRWRLGADVDHRACSDANRAGSLNHFQQLNSATIQGVVAPGVTMGTAMTFLDDLAARTLPPGYSVDYGGQFRQLKQEGGRLPGHLRLRADHHLPVARRAV